MQIHGYGPELTKLRNKVELSQGDVAKALKLASPQFISNWERGHARVPAFTLPRLADIYKVKKDTLAGIIASDYKKKLVASMAAVKKAGAKKPKAKKAKVKKAATKKVVRKKK